MDKGEYLINSIIINAAIISREIFLLHGFYIFGETTISTSINSFVVPEKYYIP